MKAHILQHVPFEDIGIFKSYLDEIKAEISYTRFFGKYSLPEPDGIGLVIIMGGPMSVNDEKEFPWLAEEKQFVKKIIKCGIPVLGVCLGAQIIASVLGARVCKAEHKEIGWFDIYGRRAEGVFNFPEKLKVFHWHGETFGLPSGAELLAESRACKNQAFQYGRNVIGLQFHLETTPETAALLAENSREDFSPPGPYVQTEHEILSTGEKNYKEINKLAGDLLEYLFWKE